MDSPGAIVRFRRGAVAGILATVPMTAVMEVLRHGLAGATKSDAFIPRQVAEGLARRGGFSPAIDALGQPGWWIITTVSHFSFGGAAGAVYGLLRHDRRKSSVQSRHTPPNYSFASPRKLASYGAGFGVLVWAVHYLIIFPCIGILRPQADRPVRKNVNLICSHLIWGAMTALIFERRQSFSKSASSNPSKSNQIARHHM